jgi:hypothetical protein
MTIYYHIVNCDTLETLSTQEFQAFYFLNSLKNIYYKLFNTLEKLHTANLPKRLIIAMLYKIADTESTNLLKALLLLGF